MSVFQKAEKSKSKLRCAMFGTSGSGKTYSALRLATGMAGENDRIAVIDTEFGSASLYADRFDFDVVEAGETPTTEQMTYFLQVAAKEGYAVIIIDSLTHAWQELLAEVDKIRQRSNNKNGFAAWGKITPKQKDFIRALQKYPGHIIATMRQKTTWELSENEKGKLEPTRMGLDPEQGKGIEYEFTVLIQINNDHSAEFIKDRTGKYQDVYIEKIDETLGKEMIEWLNTGKERVEARDNIYKAKISEKQVLALHAAMSKFLKSIDMIDDIDGHEFIHWICVNKYNINSTKDLTEDQAVYFINKLDAASMRDGAEKKSFVNLIHEYNKDTKEIA